MLRVQTFGSIAIFLFSLVLGCSGTALHKQHSPFAGTWNYLVTDPTGETYAGVLIINEQNGVLAGRISNEALSVDRDVTQFSLLEGQLSFAFDAGSYGEIQVTVSTEGRSMNGAFANQTIGEMPLNGLRVSSEVAGTLSATASEQTINTDPSAVQVYTSDIENFWEAFDKAVPDFAPEVFQELYLDKGSIGVKGFMRYRIQNAIHLAETVKKTRTAIHRFAANH